MNKLLSISILSLAMVAPAYSQGGYMGFGVGQATNDGCDDQPSGTECKDSKTVGRIVGGYQFNDNFAIEGAYSGLGEASLSALSGPEQAKLDGDAFSVSALGIIPLSETLNLYGKLGYSRWNVDASLTDASGTTFTGDEDGNDPVYGLGLAWHDDGYSLRLEYERYRIGLDEGNPILSDAVDSDVISLTYTFSF